MPPDPIDTNNDARLADNIRVLLDGLPEPVRDYVTSDRLDADVLSIGRKYQLHSDQSGRFHQALIFMLLGVYTPERFVDTLEDNGFPEDTVEGLLADVNARVFVPLRKAEREADKTERKPAPPLVPVPAPIEVRPAPVVTPPPAPKPIPPPVVPIPAPVPPPAAVASPVPPPVPRPAPLPEAPKAPVVPAEPTMRTMAHDVEAMQGGHAPTPLPYTPHTPTPAVPKPVPPPIAIPSAPVAPPPRPPAPSAPPAAFARPITAPEDSLPPHPTRTFGAPDPKEVTSTLQKYGIDPYREAPE